MTADIVLTVDEGRPADAARFFAAGVHLLDLLDDLSETAAVEWQIADLQVGSAISALAASGEHRSEGVDAARSVVTGLARIRSGQGMPADWTPNAVAHAKDLVRRAGDRAKVEAADNVVWLDQRLREGLEAIAPWVREFYGSVRGQLTGVNVTRTNRASIKPQGGGRVVHVGFPTSLAEDMRDGLLEFVEVEGMVRQNEDGRTYYVSADDIRVVRREALTWGDLYGYMPEITEGMAIRALATWRPSVAKNDTKRVLLDTSALIAWIKGEPAAERIAGVLGMIDRGEAILVESVLVFAEVYKKSTATNKAEREAQDAKLETIRAKLDSPEVVMLDVTSPVARRAAEYRKQFGLKTPDAVLLATAVLNRCDWLLTLDTDFPSQVEQLRVFRAELLDADAPVPWNLPVQESLFQGEAATSLSQREDPVTA